MAATFPPLTPSGFRWSPPQYAQTVHVADNTAVLRQILADAPGEGRLSLTFQNRKDSDFELLLQIYDQCYGQWDALLLPAEVFAGRDALLSQIIQSYEAGLQWAFAGPPTADWAKNGRCTINVELKQRQTPLALSVDPPGTADPPPAVPEDTGVPAVTDDFPYLNCLIPPPPPEPETQWVFWVSRLDTPTGCGSNTDDGNDQMTMVHSDGSVYTVLMLAPFGTTNERLTLTKRDGDGNVLWKKLSNTIDTANRLDGGVLLEAGDGVILARTGSFNQSLMGIHRFDGAGVNLWSVGVPRGSSSDNLRLPRNWVYSPTNDVLYGIGATSNRIRSYCAIDASTGAVTAFKEFDMVDIDLNALLQGWPSVTTTGNMIYADLAGGATYLYEMDSSLNMVNQSVYSGGNFNGNIFVTDSNVGIAPHADFNGLVAIDIASGNVSAVYGVNNGLEPDILNYLGWTVKSDGNVYSTPAGTDQLHVYDIANQTYTVKSRLVRNVYANADYSSLQTQTQDRSNSNWFTPNFRNTATGEGLSTYVFNRQPPNGDNPDAETSTHYIVGVEDRFQNISGSTFNLGTRTGTYPDDLDWVSLELVDSVSTLDSLPVLVRQTPATLILPVDDTIAATGGFLTWSDDTVHDYQLYTYTF